MVAILLLRDLHGRSFICHEINNGGMTLMDEEFSYENSDFGR